MYILTILKTEEMIQIIKHLNKRINYQIKIQQIKFVIFQNEFYTYPRQ